MTVSQVIEKLKALPQDMEVLIDVSRSDDKDFVFTVPDKVDIVADSMGTEFVFIGGWQEDELLNLN